MQIKVRYESIDGFRKTRTFATIAGAKAYASRYVGETPDIAAFGRYAVSDDGIGKIMVEGATMADLFPMTEPAPSQEPAEFGEYDEYYSNRKAEIEAAEAYAAEMRELMAPKRGPGCTCSDQQLNLVGCDCAESMPF